MQTMRSTLSVVPRVNVQRSAMPARSAARRATATPPRRVEADHEPPAPGQLDRVAAGAAAEVQYGAAGHVSPGVGSPVRP